MPDLVQLPYLRPCDASDDTFLYDVFCTTWQSEVATLPNQNLARHVLRIQHIAQERRFETRYPGYQRFVVVEDLERIGRLYLHDDGSRLQVVDLTLLTAHRSRGVGSRVLRDLFEVATRAGRSINLRVGRNNQGATDLYTTLGFRLSDVDDLDNYFEWSPSTGTEQTTESAHHTSVLRGAECC